MEARGEPLNNTRIFAIWLGRVLANALVGGLAFAVVGAFCGGGAAFIVSLFEAGALSQGAFIGVPFGAIVGFVCGIAGIFIHLFPALKAEPGDFWEPFFDLTAPIAFGQFWGTVGACTAYLAFELIAAPIRGTSLSTGVSEDMLIFAFGASILMICGAIASAILRRD